MPLVIPAGYGILTYKLASADVTDGYAITTIAVQGVDATDLEPQANAARIAWTDNWLTHMLNEYTLESCTLVTQTLSFTSPSGAVGTGTGEPAPSNIALLIHKKGVFRGRRNQGRMFIPGVLDRGSISGDGVINSGDLLGFQTALNGWYSDLVTAGLLPFILHADNSAPSLISAMSVDPRVATQRRRLRR